MSAPVAAYQDRYINGGSLPPDVSQGDYGTSDSQGGLARTLQVDGVLSLLTSHDAGPSTNVVENGLIVRSQWETASYGAWSLDASARTGSSGLGNSAHGQAGVATLRQRGMPFDGGWLADNGLGDLNSTEINLARFQPRFYLPTGPMQGATTEWRGPSGMQLVAGAGVPGLYDGIAVPDFHTLNGNTATIGAQGSPTSHWTVGGQIMEAHDVNLFVNPVSFVPALLSSTTGLLTAAWQDRGERAQLSLIDGHMSGHSSAGGGWLDASLDRGRFLQTAGVFRIEPDLSWGNQPIANDVQGGYYRLGYHSRQWFTDVGIDEVHSVSGLGSNTTFLTGDTRYQILRDWGVGALANVSRNDAGTSWSLESYVDHLNRWGTGRAQVDVAKNPSGRELVLTLDETWLTPVGVRLSTAAALDHVSGSVVNGLQQDGTALSINVYGGGQFTTRLGVEGNVRWSAAVQGRAAPGLYANVSLTWQLSPNWSLLASYFDSRIGSWAPLTVTSPLTPPLATTIPAVQERGAFLTIRYLRSSGSHFAPLGGGPGAGSGELTGIVYLDANGNGRLDAGEAGAPNVTVVLDGRFSVQTDSGGRFFFPPVVAGHHVLTVISDNLPLPWRVTNGGRVEVEVTTRTRTDIGIAAQRDNLTQVCKPVTTQQCE